ncbi:BTB/POZ domain-containing protein POB1 [Capsicum chinense]|nr:BTB/POZ domain-containing protein POB1 [Capsicum chinense]
MAHRTEVPSPNQWDNVMASYHGNPKNPIHHFPVSHRNSGALRYDIALKWARKHYPKLEKRWEVWSSHLCHLIRFPFMTERKLRKVIMCNDFDPKLASKLVIEALFYKDEAPYWQRSIATKAGNALHHCYVQRASKYRPVKALPFETPRQQCIIYLDLKRDECARLFPAGKVYSQVSHLGGRVFPISMLQHGSTKWIQLLWVVSGYAREGGSHLQLIMSLQLVSVQTRNILTKSLEVILHEHAFKSLVHQHTGSLYNASVPSSLAGMKLSLVRLRSRTLWEKGANFSGFSIPPRTILVPYVKRIHIVYNDLGNLSSHYFNLSGYNLLTSVIGFIVYDAPSHISTILSLSLI